MTAQTWNSLQTTLLAALSKTQPPYTTVPADFAALYPQATSYAEGRIYRDVPMLAQRAQNTSLTTTASSRQIALSGLSPSLLVAEGLALITPSGTSSPASGTRVWYDEASLDLIDLVWPSEATTAAPSVLDPAYPRYWAMRDASTIVLCPTPDKAYTVELTGLFQQTPISSTNPSTYLSTTYPEILEAACMVFLAGALMHNFGAMADLPAQSISWEKVYQDLLPGVRSEEARRRGVIPDGPTPPAPNQMRPA